MAYKLFKLATKILWGACVIILVSVYNIPHIDEYNINRSYQIQPDNFMYIPKKHKSKQDKKKTKKQRQKKEAQRKASKKILASIIIDSVGEKHGTDGFKYSENKYLKLCKGYQDICDLTSFKGEFSIDKQIKYQAIVIYVIDKIDSFITSWKDLQTTLYSFKITDKSGRRGFAGHHSVIVNTISISSYREFFEVTTHELSHVIDLGVLKGDSKHLSKKYTEFDEPTFHKDDRSLDFYKFDWKNENTREKTSSRHNFVSWYGMTNTFEDFAESANMYLNHNSLFKKMAQNNYIISQKYTFMKRLFDGKYIFSNNSKLDKLKNNPTWRPWDSTKINS